MTLSNLSIDCHLTIHWSIQSNGFISSPKIGIFYWAIALLNKILVNRSKCVASIFFFFLTNPESFNFILIAETLLG